VIGDGEKTYPAADFVDLAGEPPPVHGVRLLELAEIENREKRR